MMKCMSKQKSIIYNSKPKTTKLAKGMKQEKLNFWHIPLGMLVAVAVLALMMCSCKSIEYVPVVENHTEHHWHADSVKERDSTHTERETIIREVDSAAMAKYGIQMERNQRAWLVLFH